MARPGQAAPRVKKKPAKPAFYDEMLANQRLPKDATVTKGQLHARNAMANRYNVEPDDIAQQVGIADPLDPVQKALRQQAQNPRPERGDLEYSDYGRVRDPASGRVFHKGRPHSNAYQPEKPLPPITPESVYHGLSRAIRDTAGGVADLSRQAVMETPGTGLSQGLSRLRGRQPLSYTVKERRITEPQQASATGATPMAKPYQPQMTDPGSGRKMQKGRPVANAGPSVPPPSVTDPYSGGQMKKGRPAHTPYSGDLNSRVALGLRTAGTALGMGFGPPKRPDMAQPQPPSAPSAPSRSGLSPRGLATPSAVKGSRTTKPTPLAAPGARGAPFTTTMDQMQAAKPNTPGYSDFPPVKRAKPPPYPY